MKIGRFKSEADREQFAAAYDDAMGTMPEPTSTTNAETTFGRVRAYTWAGDSEAPPVLLLPGMRAGAPMWSENLADFRESGRSVVALDALGDAGMSVQTKPLASVVDQAQWLDEALDGMGVASVHAVGHSFGGATAAGYALRFPERVASLTLLEPVFTLRWPPPSTFFWATIAALPVPARWREHALAAIGGVTVEDVRTPSAISTLISEASRTFASALPTPRPLSATQLATLRMPTYVAIASQRSLAGGPAAAAAARAALPAGTVEIWPETTHSLPMQVRHPLGERLRAFWTSADQSAPDR